MAISVFTINLTDWTAITTAGKSGTVWIWKKIKGDIIISHGASSPTIKEGFKLNEPKPPHFDTEPLSIIADTINDIFYARVKNDGDSSILCIDVI